MKIGQTSVGDLLADFEIEVVEGGEGRETRGQAKHGEHPGVIPSGEHRIDGAGEEANGWVAVEILVEVEARGDAETRERRAQHRGVGFWRADDDADIAEGASGGGLLYDAPGDLVGFPLDVGGVEGLHAGAGTAAREWGLAAGREACPTLECNGDLGVAVKRGDDGEFGLGERMEAVEPDGSNAGKTLGRDAFGSKLEAAGTGGEIAAGKLAIDFSVHGQEGGGER